MWKHIFWNEINLNKLGETSLTEKKFTGEIQLVRVEVGDSGPDTLIEIETSEGEVIKYKDIAKSFVDYPIHGGNPEFKIFTGEEGVPNLVRYLNHGNLIVRVSGDPNSKVNRIVIIFEV